MTSIRGSKDYAYRGYEFAELTKEKLDHHEAITNNVLIDLFSETRSAVDKHTVIIYGTMEFDCVYQTLAASMIRFSSVKGKKLYDLVEEMCFENKSGHTYNIDCCDLDIGYRNGITSLYIRATPYTYYETNKGELMEEWLKRLANNLAEFLWNESA